ncbi:hypothetical protein PFISCL1PPCAC_21038, partial [Pristionchus fissidentatus]
KNKTADPLIVPPKKRSRRASSDENDEEMYTGRAKTSTPLSALKTPLSSSRINKQRNQEGNSRQTQTLSKRRSSTNARK